MSKKILHKINYYFLEYEETEKLISNFSSLFGKDFAEELNFQNMKNIEKEEKKEADDEADVIDEKINQDDFHELYKQIAKETHPDRHGEKFIEEFKKANEAYNTKNWIDLIVLAGELDIKPPEFNEEVLELIDENMKNIEDNINSWKSSLAWQWGMVDDKEKEKLKKKFRAAMGIKEDEYKEFLKNLES